MSPLASLSFVVRFPLSALCAGACVGALSACATAETIEVLGTGGGTSKGGSAAAGDAGDATGGTVGSGGTVSGVGGTSPSGGSASSGSGGGSSTGAATGSGGSSSNGGAASGGTMATGGAASSGGGKATGGAAGAGGSSSGGANTGGGKATGGTASGGSGSGSGGKATGGTAGSGGKGGCADGDGDGITDCDEMGDGSDWTDPTVFNGLHVQRGNQCSGAGNCNENDTQQEVNACMQNNVDEELNQHAGWDWNDSPDSICDADYGFAPNWARCDVSWAARWSGCIHFDTAGPHCFQITGETDEGCAGLYFNGNTGNADAQTGTAVKCFSVAAGNYPLMFHYTMDENSHSGMHVRYCDAQGGSTCTPTVAIPSRMLRTSCQ